MSKIIENGEIHFGVAGFENEPVFYLDHSCDEWVIGDLKEAKKFLADLQKTIEAVEAAPTN